MLGKLEVVINENGGLEFNVERVHDVYMVQIIASLEEYTSKNMGIDISEIREIIDEEKSNLVAKPSEG